MPNKIKRFLKNKILLFLIPIIILSFLGWGSIGHSIINYNTILTALPEMNFFEYWADSLAAHGSDADDRKSIDPDEAPKHYIDIDNYPEFISTGTIPQNFDSLVAIHGYQFVIDQGILPWAILHSADSLQAAFENNNLRKAMLLAADLGHYIADSHMPLHITRNYNGQYTGQYGVHSRYESGLIQRFQNQIIYEGDSLQYIDNLPGYIFNMIYDNYIYVDSVLYADATAKTFAGNTTSTAYYNKFWELSKNFTIELFRKASYRLTCVIYTTWINAGGTVPVELTSFTASLSNNKVNLNWATASELNNHGFEIERSLDKSEWATVGFKEGKGTTTEPQQYSYSGDISDITTSMLYYRLKQLDFNGSFKYSKIVEVEIAPLTFSLEQNYPNPFNPSTTIKYTIPNVTLSGVEGSRVQLKVYDALGNEVTTLVDEYKPAGSYEVSFDALQLSSGIYFYQLKVSNPEASQGRGFVETKKMILIK